MDISAPVTVTVLPASRGRRWLPTRRTSEPMVPHEEPSGGAEPTEVSSSAPDTATGDPVAAATTTATAIPSELAPLAAFGRWMADFDDSTTEAPAQPDVESAITTVTGALAAYSSSVTSAPAAVTVHAEAPAYEPSPVRADDSPKIAELTRDLKDLTDELETVRQRNAAERMHLLEELASARDARRAAETELATVQAILDAAERRLPAPRRGTLHAVS